MEDHFLQSSYAQEIMEFHCPRYDELPGIDLYMDQVLSVIEDALRVFSLGEKMLTSSMVNNYVKQKIVSPPVNKKYSRKHLAYLMVVCILKKVFSISEICRMITMQMESHPLETTYDLFCQAMEQALRTAFVGDPMDEMQDKGQEAELLRSAVLSFAQKVRVQKYLEYRLEKDHAEEKGE